MLHCFYCLFALLQEFPVATRCSYQISRKFKEIKKKKKRTKTAFPNVWNCLGYVMIIKLSKKLKNTWVFTLCLISLRFPWGQGKRKKNKIKRIKWRLDLPLLPVEGLPGLLPDQTSLAAGVDPAAAPATQFSFPCNFGRLNLKNKTVFWTQVTLFCPGPCKKYFGLYESLWVKGLSVKC